jgi:hypothetical protein
LVDPFGLAAEDPSPKPPQKRTPSPPFPGFPPDDPDIVTSHTSLEIILTDMLKPGNVCGDIQLKVIKRCTFTINWIETRSYGCRIPQEVFNKWAPNGDVCAYLAAEAKKKGIYKIPCPGNMKCCNKKKYWGTHNLTISAKDLPIPYVRSCKVTFKLTANVGIVGELGVCTEDAAAGGKK